MLTGLVVPLLDARLLVIVFFLAQICYLVLLNTRALFHGLVPNNSITVLQMSLQRRVGFTISFVSYFIHHSLLLCYIVIISAQFTYLPILLNQHTKHIEIDIHFMQDKVAMGQVCVLHITSLFQYAEIFMKWLSSFFVS